ncbi:MAG: PVC-type heme-binding CxxCH protein, partial [Halioglobus sp.]
IVGRRGPGENTFLRTEKTYGDFSLKMQMRWDELGNSGVLFRAQQRDGDGRAFGYQYELDASDRAWSGGIYDEARRGWLANLEENEEARVAIKLDDWNDVEIEARGAQIKTWINGVPAAEIIDGLDAEGYIALQVHSGETGVMRWRNIRLRELPPLSLPGADLLAAEEWQPKNLGALAFSDSGFSAPFTSGEALLSPRRQFSDARLVFDVPACESPTVIRLRYLDDDRGQGASFAEVSIYAEKAEGVLRVAGAEQSFDPVMLASSSSHPVVATMVGKSVVVSVGEQDILRLTDDALPSRGGLQLVPARCGNEFAVENFTWFALREGSEAPLPYETLDNEPAPVLTPQESLQAFRIAPGFEIELVAAEPLVEEPVAMAWDERGRLYVVEMRGYMRDAYGAGSEEPVGQVVRLTDTDGDGQMDESEVFLGELVNPRAIAVVNEGVLVGEPPNLFLCELPTPDALCKQPKRIGVYGEEVATANVEHLENGLRQGLDNWLYNSKSTRLLKLTGENLEVREGLFRGQWGITKDNYGRMLYNHNSTWIQADYFAAEDILVPGRPNQYAGLGVNLTNPPEVFSVRVNPGVNRAYLDSTLRDDGRLANATGVSGLVSYRGDQFPEQYHSHVFVPEVAGNVVAQFKITEDGIELGAEQQLYDDSQWGKRDFLGSTDERFRPVDAMNGPDGALYIIDMYRGIVQDDHFLTDELREQIFQRKLETPIGMGRIWRVRHVDGGEREPLAGSVSLASANNAQLLNALGSANGWKRDTAQRLLLVREGALQTSLEDIATGENTLAALHAIWALEGRKELTRETLLAVAAIDDTPRQRNALRAGASVLEANDLLALEKQWKDAPVALRMQLALAMSGKADTQDVRASLVALLRNNLDDTYVRQAVVRAVANQELAFLEQLLVDEAFSQPSKGGETALAELAMNAYRTLRGDLSSKQTANPALLPLLALVASREGSDAWQQVAMLNGFSTFVLEEGFTPAQFAEAPPIFADGTIEEADPLWDARLAGRVAFTWPGDELAMGIKPLSPGQLQLMAQGEAFYPQCGACHGDGGQGIDGLAPPLAGAQWVTGPPEWLGRIILQGISGPLEVKGVTWQGVMPPHGHLEALNDDTLAGLMTYLRRSWGNKADPVSAAMVADIRKASADRDAPWTAESLQQVPFDRGFGRYVGKYSVSFLKLTVTEEPEGLHLSIPMYGSGVMEQLTDTIFLAAAGGESVKLEFVVGESGEASQIIMHRKGEKIPIKRVAE